MELALLRARRGEIQTELIRQVRDAHRFEPFLFAAPVANIEPNGSTATTPLMPRLRYGPLVLLSVFRLDKED